MKLQQMMSLEMGQKFTEIEGDDIPIDAELFTDLFCDLCFHVALFQELQHSRADQIQPEHLSMTDIEHDGAVLVVGRTHLFREPEHLKTPALRLRTLLGLRAESVRNKTRRLLF
jgi:hypothetical protein